MVQLMILSTDVIDHECDLKQKQKHHCNDDNY